MADNIMSPDPAERVRALLAEARRDYLTHWGNWSRAKGENTSRLIAAQRSANRTWGHDPQPAGDE